MEELEGAIYWLAAATTEGKPWSPASDSLFPLPQRTLGGAGRLPVCICVLRSPPLTPHPSPSSPFPFSLLKLISGVSDTYWALHGHWHCDEDGQDPPLSLSLRPAAEYAPPREQRREQER